MVPNIISGTILNIGLPGATFSSLTGGGTIQTFNNASVTSPRSVTLTGGSGSAVFSGVLADNTKGLSLTMNSSGTLTQILSGVNTYTGKTTVQAGNLQVQGSLAAGSAVTISGGTLSGTGTVGNVTMSSGTLAPGAKIGIINTGNNVFTGGNFSASLFSSSTYSQDNVTGTVDLGSNTALNVTIDPAYTPASGATFTLISNDATDAVKGTFSGLAEGAAITVGSNKFTISYVGGTGNDVVLSLVSKTGSVTALSSNANPSNYGSSVTFTATVTAASGSGIPTGTASFFAGATLLGSGTLNGSGVATFSTSSLAGSAGTSITATYNGDPSYSTSTSSAVSQVVNKGASVAAVTSGTNPTVFGQSVTFTATVFGGGARPTGSVSFYAGATLLGSSALSGFRAVFSTSTLTVAANSITANYGGDANYNTTISPILTQTVNKANTTTASLASSLNPALLGQSVTFTATVAAVSPGAGIPSGTVTFFNGASTLGTGALNGAGVASFATTSLPSGISSITASYGGDGNFNTSGPSSALSQVVNAPPTFTSASTTTFQTGLAGSFQFTASGYPTAMTFSTSGTLPGGVTLTSAGLLAGTPSAGTGGTYNFTVTASNGISPNATQAFALVVNQAPAFTSA
ncbi:MAG: Ig-like domain repeat protein, partial [Planctomycetota bacterium]